MTGYLAQHKTEASHFKTTSVMAWLGALHVCVALVAILSGDGKNLNRTYREGTGYL